MEENQELLYSRLKEIGVEYKNNKKEEKRYKDLASSQNNEIKDILEKLNINNFEDENFKVSITKIDKSSLDETLVLKYLKEHGLEKYIRTKEYFEPDDLVIASNNGDLNIEDLSSFKIEKFETRLNIK